MLTSIPYNCKPEPTPYNVAVFLLNYANREDGLSLGDAFCTDFDILNTTIRNGCNATAIRHIASNYLT